MESSNNDNSNNNNSKNKHETKQSIIFGYVALGAVIACILGLLICCASFFHNTLISNEEFRQILKMIESTIAHTDAADTSSVPLAVPAESISLERLSSALSDDTPSASTDNNDKLTTLITHMENMIAIQKSGMTNDLMSFIYGILSTVLVGVCATYVMQIRTSLAEAKENAKKAETQASIVKEKADNTGSIIQDAKKATEEAKNNAEEALKQAGIAKESVEATKKAISQAQNAATIAKELQYQLKLLIIADWIMSAKTALLRFDHHAANEPIIKIRDSTPLLFSDDEFKGMMMQSFVEDSMGVGKVYNDLLSLKDNVKDFLAKSKIKYTGSELKTREIAAANYDKWIQIALDCIDDASDEMRNPTDK